MGNMRFKVGDRVRIKSIDWYNENRDEYGYVDCGSRSFFTEMSDWCGKIATIKEICKTNCYRLEEYDFDWTDEMIECKVGKVEEENQSREMLKENAKHYLEVITGGSKPKFKVGDKVLLALHPCVVNKVEWRGDSKYVGYVYTVRGTDFGKKVKEADLVFRDVEEETKPKYEDEMNGEYYSTPKYLVIPSGYQFVDENGNVINAMKIVLEKKKEYPKTYEECCEIMDCAVHPYITADESGITSYYEDDLNCKVLSFRKLLICRDAYWKIAGEEMGLGKPWELSIGTPIYYIYYNRTVGTIKNDYADDIQGNIILAFPTEEMRDAFYENFKELIETVKELL